MIKVKLEILLNDSWDEYGDKGISEDILLQDLLTTFSDQRAVQEEVLQVTIKSKQIV